MSSREYAEGLIGGWDRSGYAKQGDVAKQTAKTKWEVLQNQFANLKAQLESQRAEAQQNFSEGLGAVAEGSYDRMNKGTADLVNRGLTNSGIGNLITQADTRAKGTDVRGLLDTLGNVMTQNADKLKQGGDQLHQQGMANNQNLGETLGALGNRDMESQMAYNKGAANIAEAKEARDAENRLQAMQRARSGGGGSGGKSKEESDAEDFYKKLAINEIIADETMTRQQKSNLLKIGFDIADPNSLLGDRGTFGKPLKSDTIYSKNNVFNNQKMQVRSGLEWLVDQNKVDDYQKLQSDKFEGILQNPIVQWFSNLNLSAPDGRTTGMDDTYTKIQELEKQRNAAKYKR